MNLDCVLRVRLTADEKESLREFAGSCGYSMSELVRQLVFAGIEQVEQRGKMTDEQFYALVSKLGLLNSNVGNLERQVNRIGVNLNQIVKHYHAQNDTEAVEALNGWLHYYRETMEEVQKFSESSWREVMENEYDETNPH